MTEILCPICDWTLDLTEGEEDTGLLGALGVVPTGLTRDAIEKAELELVSHLESHTLVDWVQAMRQADVYIETIEGERDKAINDATAFAEQIASLSQQLREVRSVPRGPAPVAGPPPGVDFGAQWQEMTPAERQELLRQDRKNGVSRAMPDSLIPFIDPGKRAEGVVGRRR